MLCFQHSLLSTPFFDKVLHYYSHWFAPYPHPHPTHHPRHSPSLLLPHCFAPYPHCPALSVTPTPHWFASFPHRPVHSFTPTPTPTLVCFLPTSPFTVLHSCSHIVLLPTHIALHFLSLLPPHWFAYYPPHPVHSFTLTPTLIFFLPTSPCTLLHSYFHTALLPTHIALYTPSPLFPHCYASYPYHSFK